MRLYHLAIASSWATAIRFIRLIRNRGFPAASITVLTPRLRRDHKKSWGDVTLVSLEGANLRHADLIIMGPEAGDTKQMSREAVEAGAVVIDYSRVHRLEERVPLVVPELNLATLVSHEGIVASPSCAAIQLALVLAPIVQLAPLRRTVVATYQAASGAGPRGVAELRRQTGRLLRGEDPGAGTVFRQVVAFNVIPQVGEILEGGASAEEVSLVAETRKILSCSALEIAATAVRVPVLIGHSQAVNVVTEQPLDIEMVKEGLRRAPGVHLVEGAEAYPHPLMVVGREEVLVGRLRPDGTTCGLALWSVIDNLGKGTVLNAVQIAEGLVRQKLL